MAAEVSAEKLRPRRGACSAVDQDNATVYIFRGYGDDRIPGNQEREYEQYISVFDIDSRIWSINDFMTVSPEFSIGASCTIIDEKLVVFGGWDEGYLSNQIYELDINSMEWCKLTPDDLHEVNAPIQKNKAGMVSYGTDMVFVFGGYGYPLPGKALQKGAKYDWERPFIGGSNIGWTNEQHLFHLKGKSWIEPKTTGVPPTPCAAFSMNKIDPFRVALFGGRQKIERVNELHILDMAAWHWSGVILPTDPLQPWPSKRSFHTAVSLYNPEYVPTKDHSTVLDHSDWLPCPPPDIVKHNPMNVIKEQQLFVLWGMDNNGDPISNDMAWVLFVDQLVWKQVELPKGHTPRVWHTTNAYYSTPIHCKIITHGGVTENLFAKPDELTISTNETFILDYGVQSLFELCKEAVSGYAQNTSQLHSILPEHIVSQLGKKY